MTAKTRARISLISGVLILLAWVAWWMAQWTGEPPRPQHGGWAFIFEQPDLLTWRSLQYALLFVATVIAAWPIAVSAFKALRWRAFSIDLLVTIAVTGALIIGELVESSVVAFLFVFGSWLEARTLERTRRSISELIDMVPDEAHVVRDGEVVLVPAGEVREGELVQVRTGGRLPVDGVVASGVGFVDEATITGEPIPAEKAEGDSVFSGTVLTDGFMTVRATKVGSDTAFSRIIELVEDAQDSKSGAQRFLDRFARWYTPTIVVLALLALIVTRDIHFALTFLVIACPGALVISTPVSMTAGIGNGARNGVLLKGGDAVERLAAVDTLVVDKTGTLTYGQPRVSDVFAADENDEAAVLRMAGSLELASEHPLGRAVVARARERGLELVEPTDVRVHVGSGLSGRVDVSDVGVGSMCLAEELGVDVTGVRERVEDLERGGATVFFVMVDAVLSGVIAVKDVIREDAREIAGLHDLGIAEIVMLTGDNPRTARVVADELGIDEVRAQLLPEDKVAAVEDLKARGRKVAMIGDGVNDAPAIAIADVGIAMGTGTDISIETADVVLAGGSFTQLLHARRLARATVRNVRQNTVIAVATVVALLIGVLAGTVLMSVGMLVHEVSVVVVVLNALRLTGFKGRSVEKRGVQKQRGV